MLWEAVFDEIMQYNMLTFNENVLLTANLQRYFLPKHFNCNTCGKKFRIAEQKKAFRERKGCYDYSTRSYIIEKIEYKTCLGNFYDSSVYYLIELFLKYRDGVMPFPGSLSEQPAKIIEVFQIIEQKYREWEKEKQQEKNNGRQGGRKIRAGR